MEIMILKTLKDPVHFLDYACNMNVKKYLLANFRFIITITSIYHVSMKSFQNLNCILLIEYDVDYIQGMHLAITMLKQADYFKTWNYSFVEGLFEYLFMFWLQRHLQAKQDLNSKKSAKGYERIIQKIFIRTGYNSTEKSIISVYKVNYRLK